MRAIIGFPDVVNEKAARVVAGGVVVMTVTVLATGWTPVLVVLSFGFLARVLSGPRFSPLGLVATRVVAPRLGPARLVAGPPKRFAQGIGLTVTGAALVLGSMRHDWVAADALLAVLLIFASLEAGVGLCAGCWLFARLARAGLLPESVCAECLDISRRPRQHPTAV